MAGVKSSAPLSAHPYSWCSLGQPAWRSTSLQEEAQRLVLLRKATESRIRKEQGGTWVL